MSRKNQVKFPQHWQHLKSRGVANFITQVIHKLPSDNLHIWSSRRFRKRHSSEIKSSEIDAPEPKKKSLQYWAWKLQSLTWWIGFIFTFGSLLFVVGAIPTMFPNPPEQKISFINFLGSVCFTFGSYAAFLEVINLNLDVKLDWDVEMIKERIINARHYRPKISKIKWFGWQPHRLEYRSTLIQFVGACLFNINCFFAMSQGLNWQMDDMFIWFPSTLASIHFCLASYLAVLEVCHRYWAWNFQEIEWWVVVLNLLGSIGFLSGSLFGFLGQGAIICCQEWGTNFSFLWGSILFLGGSYLMIPEMLQE
jgi:hypothetical protein